MLDAVEAGQFEEMQAQILLKNVPREFQHKIPAAKEAYERVTKR